MRSLESRLQALEKQLPALPDPAHVASRLFDDRLFRHLQETRDEKFLAVVQQWIVAGENWRDGQFIPWPEFENASDDAVAATLVSDRRALLHSVTFDEARAIVARARQWEREAWDQALARCGVVVDSAAPAGGAVVVTIDEAGQTSAPSTEGT